MTFWLGQLELVLRLVVACICGISIGYERQNRLKVAGVRTHLIVALASALIMIVSKYGFQDVLGQPGVGLDPSRIAAQIVTGVGFLGAGIIFVRKREISGLTTAAGVWATCGVGMALGAGLYFIGVVTALLIIVVQILLHKNWRILHAAVGEHIAFELENGDEALQFLQEELRELHISIISLKVKRLPGGTVSVDFYLRVPEQQEMAELLRLFRANPQVLSVEL